MIFYLRFTFSAWFHWLSVVECLLLLEPLLSVGADIHQTFTDGILFCICLFHNAFRYLYYELFDTKQISLWQILLIEKCLLI